jgi:hypothetical protein
MINAITISRRTIGKNRYNRLLSGLMFFMLNTRVAYGAIKQTRNKIQMGSNFLPVKLKLK